MTTPPNRFAGKTPDEMCAMFFDEVARYRDEFCARTAELALRTERAAAEHSLSARHNGNLYRSADGRVWSDCPESSGQLEELVRCGNRPLAPYISRSPLVRTPREQLAPLTRSISVPEEAWGWEDLGVGPGSAHYARKSREYAQTGVEFANRVLSQRAEITPWLLARGVDCTRTSEDGRQADVLVFMRRFAPLYREGILPDTGAVFATLRTVLDRIGGRLDTAYYC